jgi:Animal haem peroxidase
MAQHGSAPLRGLLNTQQSSIGAAKFGRMFRWLPPAHEAKNAREQLELEALFKAIAKEMITSEFVDNVEDEDGKGKFHDADGKNIPDAPLTVSEPNDENDLIPAGYTYFGQFVDHDITFDPASSLQQTNDPDALEDFRTPRLDLDSVYGRGPDDQPYLYDLNDKRNTFLLGASQGIGGKDRPDLQRITDGTAIVGDKRNDENKIVSQLQALFLKFHNTVFRKLKTTSPSLSDDDRFSEAQRIVRWCYQWVVLNDFLPRICQPQVYDKIKPDGKSRGPHLSFYSAHGEAFIPVEFAVAAYRFGHSMVRPSYALNEQAKSTGVFRHGHKVFHFGRIPIFVAESNLNTDALNGFGDQKRGLPTGWGIDWNFFFGPMTTKGKNDPKIPQPSYRIDTKLVDPLGRLPEFVAKGVPSPFESLAFRNLLRGASLGLPSGQSIARMIGASKILSDAELWNKHNDGDDSEDWAEGKALLADHGMWLQDNAPLWFYILKEAEVHEKGRRLGEVGSRIVAETLFGLAWFDHYSYMFQRPGWKPEMEFDELKDLDMLKLANFANGEI